MSKLVSPSFYRWIILVASFFVMMTYGVFLSYGLFFEPIIKEFGWSRAAVSAALSIYYSIHSLCGIFMAWVYGRYGPRASVGLGGFLVGVGLSLCSQVTAIWHLYLFFTLASIGASAFFISINSVVANWFVDRRGLAIGTAMSGLGLGISVLAPVVHYLIASYDWRIAFTVIGVSFLIIDTVAATTLKYNPEKIRSCRREKTIHTEGQLLTSSIRGLTGLTPNEVIKTNSFWVLYLIFTCFTTTISMIVAHLVPFAIDAGILPAIAAGALSLIGLSSVLGRIVIGVISDRVGRSRALFISSVIQIAMIFWIMRTTNVWMLYIFTIFFGFSYGGYTMIGPMTAEFFGLAYMSTNLAILDTSYGLGGVLGPILGGYIFDVTGSYYFAFLLSATFCVIAILFSFLTKPPKKQKE